jgi:hypothetical protein
MRRLPGNDALPADAIHRQKKASRGKPAGRVTFEGKRGFQRFLKWSEVRSTVRPQLAMVRTIAVKGKLLAEWVKKR